MDNKLINAYNNIINLFEADKDKDTFLILIQGLPGSGKSTLAKYIVDTFNKGVNQFINHELLDNPRKDIYGDFVTTRIMNDYHFQINHFEADSFFMTGDEYKFNPRYLKQAHNLCFDNTYKSLYHHNHCIVSNTFLSNKELDPYIDFLLEFNYIKVILVKMTTQYKSIHNISDDVMVQMKKKFETKMTYTPDIVV